MFVEGKEFEDGFEDEFEENRYIVTRENEKAIMCI